MFSVIIPTLLKSEYILNRLLEELVNLEEVGEILIIDNSLQGFTHCNEKVKTIIPKENLYVNPSWNLGVSNANFDYIAILNDDLLIPKELFGQIYKFIKDTPQVGVIGLDQKVIKCVELKDFGTYPQGKTCKFTAIGDITNVGYWGSAMFCKKENFYEIPKDIKIWFGDNYQIKMNYDNGKQNYKVDGGNIKHYGSLSAISSTLDDIKRSDVEKYSLIDERCKDNDLGYHKLSLLETIFSVRNSRDKKSKILTILGLSITIKKQ